MMSPYLQIIGICIVMALAIAAYGTLRCRSSTFTDPLTYSPLGPPWDKFLDGWGVSHLVFYGVLAYMYPSWPTLAFIALIGIAWEVIESLAKDRPFYLSECKYSINTDHAAGAGAAGWWYGRWQDIVMNSLGMVIGLALRHVVVDR